MSDEYEVSYFLSTVPTMLEKANALLSLAENDTENSSTLAACASVIFAVSLDQGTSTVLEYHASLQGRTHGTAAAVTKCGLLSTKSLRKRVVELPEAATDGKLTLDRRARDVRIIHDLITLRNELVHIGEEPGVLDMPDDFDPFSEDPSPVINLPLPELNNKWLLLKLEEAKRYRMAVELYVREVLFPDSGEISRGQIVVPAVWGARR